ncbi:hypothetical protein K525DRAFT_289458 [Schizophyllum commune Loenen D]|nr:hypothetical protein K525DRAFT_289458 [Schizophyllum commune Loenen D]
MLATSKTKDKQETEWEADWWQFQPLLDRTPTRPVEWSTSSLIFTADHSSPILTARHFSSSKQFELPPPATADEMQNFMTTFRPPTLISAAPSGDWLFAYYPGNGKNRCCLWHRGDALDSWTVNDHWSEPSDVIAAEWVGIPREWTVNDDGTASRLPPRGSPTPVLFQGLVVVTRNHSLKLFYYRHYQKNVKIIPLTLMNMCVNVEANTKPEIEGPPLPGCVRLCAKAAIGVNYNDSSLLIASRLYRVPARSAVPQAPFDVDEDPQGIEWEQWGEEPTIELAECALRFNGEQMSLHVQVMPPLHPRNAAPVAEMAFASVPPRAVEGQQTPTTPGERFLVVSHLDFGDYTSPPKSELSSYSLVLKDQNTTKRHWEVKEEATRSFEPDVVTSLVPCKVPTRGIYATVLHRSGKYTRGRERTCIGQIRHLNLPDLADAPNSTSASIVIPAKHIGCDLPLYTTISPNGSLLCAVAHNRPNVYLLPQSSSDPSAMVEDDKPAPPPHLARQIAAALYNRRRTGDLTHLLTMTSTPIDDARDTLAGVLQVLQKNASARTRVDYRWIVLGLAVEMYRSRAQRAKDEEKTELGRRWRAGRDMCSLFAIQLAFKECSDENGKYHLDALWQLVSLCSWFVGYLERLMKETVQFGNLPSPEKPKEEDDLFGSAPTSPENSTSTAPSGTETIPSPTLLPFSHVALTETLLHVVQQVNKLREQVNTANINNERAFMAKNVLVDVVDCAGVSLKDLEKLFEEVKGMVDESIDETQQRLSLVSCKPMHDARASVHAIARKIATSSVLDKMRLFIRPTDLVDGLGRLSLGDFDPPSSSTPDDAATPLPDTSSGTSSARKEHDRDMVTKAPLGQQREAYVCLRCGGKSDLPVDLAEPEIGCQGWRIWEGRWASECICGGSWITAANA